MRATTATTSVRSARSASLRRPVRFTSEHNTLVDGSLELEKIIPFVADNISVLIAAVSRFIDGLAQIAYAGMTLDAVIEQDLFPKLG